MRILRESQCAQGVEWGESLPPVLLLHGTSDTCALVSNATQFSQALDEAGAQVSCLRLPSILGRLSSVCWVTSEALCGPNLHHPSGRSQ